MTDSRDLLTKITDTSTESEFFAPLPANYKKGKTRYVFVMGTVMSGLGKGIFSSCLAKLLQDKGLKVAPIKLEGYLNIDSGTLNPFRHGEVFVLDDGMETDMDLGTYERMLDQDLSRANFATSGQIFSSVLNKERHGDYLGRDVQMIPHVTGEVKLRLRELAADSKADVVFVEIGGTVGDLENAYFIEAMRELAYEEGPGSVCFVALTYILEPPALGEQKSKAAQLGIKQLMELGIQPDIIVCRATNPVNEKVRQKISVYTNVPMERVISHARLGQHLHDPGDAPRRRPGLRGPAAAQDRRPRQPAPRAKAWARVVRLHRQNRHRQVRDHHRHHRQVHLRPRQLRLDHQRPGARRHRAGLRREDQVDRHDRDHRRQRGQAPGRRGRHHRARRVRRPRHRGQDRLREVRPREQTCRTWACASGSRWR